MMQAGTNYPRPTRVYQSPCPTRLVTVLGNHCPPCRTCHQYSHWYHRQRYQEVIHQKISKQNKNISNNIRNKVNHIISLLPKLSLLIRALLHRPLPWHLLHPQTWHLLHPQTWPILHPQT